MAVSRRLAAFLAREAARPWDWQDHDCGLWLADWFVVATGRPDPAAHLRGLYGSESECVALFGRAAIARMTRDVCRRAGIPRTAAAVIGDISIIEVPLGSRHAVGGISVGTGWVVPASYGFAKGLTRVPAQLARVVAAWRIEEQHAADAYCGR